MSLIGHFSVYSWSPSDKPTSSGIPRAVTHFVTPPSGPVPTPVGPALSVAVVGSINIDPLFNTPGPRPIIAID